LYTCFQARQICQVLVGGRLIYQIKISIKYVKKLYVVYFFYTGKFPLRK